MSRATRPEVLERELHWWREDEDAHEQILRIVERVHSNAGRDAKVLHCRNLYGDESPDFGVNPSRASAAIDALGSKRLAYNVVRSVVDTVVSKFAINKPRVQALTSGGDWALQQRAKKLTKFLDGQFLATRYDRFAALRVRDAALYGTGITKVVAPHGRLGLEQVFPHELLVDPRDAEKGEPKCLYQVHYVDRGVLAARYPDHADKIDEAPQADAWWGHDSDSTADLIRVAEAWRMRSAPDADDGRYAVCIDGDDLEFAAWDEPEFPFECLHWTPPLHGFWGGGLGDLLTGLQSEINRLLRRIRNAQRLAGSFHLWYQEGTVDQSQFSNEDGLPIAYRGPTAPFYAPVQAIPPELRASLAEYYAKAYELAGVSQMSAQATKPAGLDSGEAIRTYHDVGDVRLAQFGEDAEDNALGISRKFLRTMRALAEENAKYDVVYRAKGHIERIKWGEVDIDESSYELNTFATSMLPKTPTGRIQMVSDLVKIPGAISPERVATLLDFPDLEAERELNDAPYNVIRDRIERTLTEGQKFYPDAFTNLDLARRLYGLAIEKAELDDTPDDRIELLRQYAEDCKAEADRRSPPMPMPMPPMGPEGPGGPGPGMPMQPPMPGAMGPGGPPPSAFGAPPMAPAEPMQSAA